MEDLLIKLKENFKDIELTRRHIQNIIKDNYITLKLTHIRHMPIKRFGKNININEKIKEFYNEIKKYKIEDIICIDESSINSLEKRKHCYSNKGKRCTSSKHKPPGNCLLIRFIFINYIFIVDYNNNYYIFIFLIKIYHFPGGLCLMLRCTIKTDNQEVFKKYTAIFAICHKGVLGWTLYEKGGMDSNRLKTFLEDNITSKYKNKLIILDNASSHRNEMIKNLINKDNYLLYSCAYQHYTNAIENFFSMFKSKLQKLNGLTYSELKSNISNVIKKITKDKYINILKGAYKREQYVKKISNRTKKIKGYL